MSIKRKIRKTKQLLSEGNFGGLFFKLLEQIPFYNDITRSAKYLYLRRKYRPLLDVHPDTQKLRIGGGHKDIIWRLWLQGTDEAPQICKSCLASLRRWHPDKEIITLDKNNLSDYITLPEHITRKHEQGIISHTHYSDIVRAQLLAEHGGTWADSTVFCTGRRHEEIMHLPLFVFQEHHFASASSSWFIVSDPHNPVITLTRDLLFKYWENYDYLMHYFLFHMFFKMASEVYAEEFRKMPYFSNRPPHAMQRAMYEDYSEEKMERFAEMSDFHKLSWKIDPDNQPSASSIFRHVESM